MAGKLILVVGPTGSGKGTLESYLQQQMPELVWPISCTTRAMRPGEKNGERYWHITKEEFSKREVAGDFLEWAAYGGNYYGTLKSEILPKLAEGKTVIREVEVQGARQIVETMSAEVLRVVYIDGGSWDELEKRVLKRAQMDETELLARRKRYEDEITFKPHANIVVNNPDGGQEQAKKDFVAAVQKLIVE